jgi:toxin FitB
MNLVDSSAWLEYFAGGPNAAFFAAAVQDTKALLVPTVVLAEVFRRILSQRGEDAALQFTAAMMQAKVADMDTRAALLAAQLGHECRLAFADSVILATARLHNATIWTQDTDLKGLPMVNVRTKK